MKKRAVLVLLVGPAFLFASTYGSGVVSDCDAKEEVVFLDNESNNSSLKRLGTSTGGVKGEVRRLI